MDSSGSVTLDNALREQPPGKLFHYTSPEGFIGILSNKKVWATNVTFLNDRKEINHCVDYARNVINNIVDRIPLSGQEKSLLRSMHEWAGSASRRIYVFSLTQERDLLSQWRAYCPPGGGYSIGVPTRQLKLMANKQNFRLWKCIYDHDLQYQSIHEIIEFFLAKYRNPGILVPTVSSDPIKQVSWEFAQHLALFGAVFKHPSFKEEVEWRLVSPFIDANDQKIQFRPAKAGIVPYCLFDLLDAEHPDLVNVEDAVDKLTIVIGPTENMEQASQAVQFFGQRYLEGGCAIGPSDIPYRGR